MAKYFSKKQLENFKIWLQQQGASILAPTNPYELIRFECILGTGVLYTNSTGQQKMSNGLAMFSAIEAYKTGTFWHGKQVNVKKTIGRKTRKSLRDKLIERDGEFCFFCDKPVTGLNLTLEHYVALAAGGPNTLNNMVLACIDCNNAVDCMNVIEKAHYRDKKRGIILHERFTQKK